MGAGMRTSKNRKESGVVEAGQGRERVEECDRDPQRGEGTPLG